MRILVVSDTHGRDKNLETVLESCGRIDLLIHAGDVQHSADYIRVIAGCPVYMVAGNNDYFSDLPEEVEFQLGKYRVFLAHGHFYCVNAGYNRLRREGRARGAHMVIFGHTHRPFIETEKDLTLLNPGSISFPRQEGKNPTYMIIEMDERDRLQFTIHTL